MEYGDLKMKNVRYPMYQSGPERVKLSKIKKGKRTKIFDLQLTDLFFFALFSLY